MLIGRLRLFLEMEPDALISPNTILKAINFAQVENVLIDPGIPKGNPSINSRIRRLNELLGILDNMNPRHVYVVIPDLWEPKLNVKLFKYVMSLPILKRIKVDYEPVLYVHGFRTQGHVYSELLKDGVIVGIPTMIDTLGYPKTVRCKENPEYCARDIEFALGTFDRIHFGGTGLNTLRTISGILNSPLSKIKGSYSWLSADTLAHRWRWKKDLPHKVISVTRDPAMDRQYMMAFLEKIKDLRF